VINPSPILGRFPLAPLTKGGNLPFRRLCRDFGATATCSEMIYAHQLIRGKGREPALLRHHASEDRFGVQLAAKSMEEAGEATRIACDAGAQFVDLNCGCPIYDTVKKGMGARLLQKPARLAAVLSAMVRAASVPVTVKLRVGFSADRVNIEETVKVAVESGVQSVTIHGRTREQRYSRAADWPLIAKIAAECPVPVLGNGDILIPWEARQRLGGTAIAGAVIARGALTKPWIFQELLEDREWLPDACQQWEVLVRFTEYLKEYFSTDELGRRRGTTFLSWHLDWFSRYRSLPEGQWSSAAAQHPLMQTRSLGDPILQLPGRDDQQGRDALAALLWDSPRPQDLWERYLSAESLSSDSGPQGCPNTAVM
jgi:tRNA-dihydrouridine synthase 3